MRARVWLSERGGRRVFGQGTRLMLPAIKIILPFLPFASLGRGHIKNCNIFRLNEAGQIEKATEGFQCLHFGFGIPRIFVFLYI